MSVSSVQYTSVRNEAHAILSRLGVPESAFAGEGLPASSPITGEVITHVRITSPEEASATIGRAEEAFAVWRTVPAPHRGEFVRLLAEELRTAQEDLGRLVTLETGKILSEGFGEVQEMIDICDFAVGLSRQLYGRTISTERADHRMMETWHRSVYVASYLHSIFLWRYGPGMPRSLSPAAIRWSGNLRRRRR